jgi:hypothetical protein
MRFTIRAADNDQASVHKAVLDSLIAFNDAKVGDSGYRPLALTVEDVHEQVTHTLEAFRLTRNMPET